MSRRLLIWGYGRVGSAVIHRLLHQQQIAHSPCKFDSLLVISNQPQPLNLSAVVWINDDEFVLNPKSFLQSTDVVLLTVPDNRVLQCAITCDFDGITVFHSSGATPRVIMEKADSAVFYPLQTFSLGGEVDWIHVPVFVEAVGDAEKQIAHDLAISLGVERCEEISFSQREKLHLAAVFANNFTIAMAGIAHDILEENGLLSTWIQPILAQTALNLGSENPWDKLTGPAKRGDDKTMANHQELLKNHPTLKALYEQMSGYIQAKNTKA